VAGRSVAGTTDKTTIVIPRSKRGCALVPLSIETIGSRFNQRSFAFCAARENKSAHPFRSRRCLERFRRPVAEEVLRHKATQVERSAEIEQTLHTSGLMSDMDQPEDVGNFIGCDVRRTSMRKSTRRLASFDRDHAALNLQPIRHRVSTFG